ncbi:MAG TPA: transposase [Anaerolineae bacterium]|nr:transposase [Anaerolineae bacterium]
MPSPPKLTHNTYYHIWNRGANRQNIFTHHKNYQYFLQKYIQKIAPIAYTYAYCLLPNHFHLLIKTKDSTEIPTNTPNTPSQLFSNFFNGYTRAFNRQQKRTGPLFEGRFGRKPVTTETYLQRLIIYIHRNPQTHGLIDDFRQWPYSSYKTLTSHQPTRLQRDHVYNWFGTRQHFIHAHQTHQPINLDYL